MLKSWNSHAVQILFKAHSYFGLQLFYKLIDSQPVSSILFSVLYIYNMKTGNQEMDDL